MQMNERIGREGNGASEYGKFPFGDQGVGRENRYVGVVPIDLLHHFKGSTLLQDVFIRSSDYTFEKVVRSGRTITGAMIDSLKEHKVEFVSVTSPVYYQHLKETGELDKVYRIPMKDDRSGVDAEELRTQFYNISAEAMTSRGLNQKTVDDMMKQFVGISESIIGFGNVLSSMRSISNFSEYTYKHSLEVMILSLVLAKQLEADGKIRKMTQRETMSLAIGAFFHDIGKTKVPWEILEKPGKLSDEEKKEMDTHVNSGHFLMEAWIIPALQNNFGNLIDEKILLDIVGAHHLRYDGKGYCAPEIDKGNVHILKDVVELADAFDAMATERPYQDRKHNTTIKKIIEEEGGRQFNPEFAGSMLKILVDYPENSITVFKDGSFGTVARYNDDESITVDMYGSLTAKGVETVSKGTVTLSKEDAKRDVALGVCYYNVLDRDIARHIAKNPKSELAKSILSEGSDRVHRVNEAMKRLDLQNQKDRSTFEISVQEFISAALGPQDEIRRVSEEVKERETRRVENTSKDKISKLVEAATFNRLGGRGAPGLFLVRGSERDTNDSPAFGFGGDR